MNGPTQKYGVIRAPSCGAVWFTLLKQNLGEKEANTKTNLGKSMSLRNYLMIVKELSLFFLVCGLFGRSSRYVNCA